jgi:hypothetical protein
MPVSASLPESWHLPWPFCRHLRRTVGPRVWLKYLRKPTEAYATVGNSRIGYLLAVLVEQVVTGEIGRLDRRSVGRPTVTRVRSVPSIADQN